MSAKTTEYNARNELFLSAEKLDMYVKSLTKKTIPLKIIQADKNNKIRLAFRSKSKASYTYGVKYWAKFNQFRNFMVDKSWRKW